VHALFSLLAFYYQYQCNWLPGKIHLWNDILCVELDVKPYRTKPSYIEKATRYSYKLFFVTS